jgi:cytochrome b561
MSPLLKWAAHVSHFLLYVFIIGAPLTGWIMVSSGKRIAPTDYMALGIFHIPPISFLANMPLEERMPFREFGHDGHMILVWSLIILIPIHVGAALYHHFMRRDQVLKRMLPGTTVTRA